MSIQLNRDNLRGFVTPADLKKILPRIHKAHDDLHQKKGKGQDCLGWLDLPSKVPEALVEEIEELGQKVRRGSDCLISLGIGGSYLGIRSTEEFLPEQVLLPIRYAGHHMSSDDLAGLLKYLEGKKPTVVVISKSGTTTEPALAFRVIKEFLAKRFSPAELKERIICVTDEKKGALKKFAETAGYRTFVIPDDVGGRFSVLTPVGLVPLSLIGIDIQALIEGARQGQKEYGDPDLEKNLAYQYAASRYLLYQKGKLIEVLASFYPNMFYIAEWWKQMFGESDGKNGQGIFPASVIYSTDLHSMGQLLQDGMRVIFETFLLIEKVNNDIVIPRYSNDIDGFNCVAGKGLDYVNKQAYEAAAAAHYEGDVPNMTITLERADAFHIGQLYYFFEKAVGISGYLLGVNPFDQPGVEAYKEKMFKLLGKS